MITKMGYDRSLLYSTILTCTGVIFTCFHYPEMKGRSIESTDDLSRRLPWTVYKHAYPTEEEKIKSNVQAARQIDKSISAALQMRGINSVHVEAAR
jgi:hypothetical protein